MNIGIIGTGSISAAHALGINSLDDKIARMHSCCDINKENLQKFSEEYGGKPYPSIDSMLDDKELDGVIICLPHGLHAEIGIKAMQAGKHVLLEKPMAPTMAECRRLLDCMNETGKILQIGHEYHLYPAIREARKIIDSGELGKPLAIQSSLSSYIYNKLGTWWMDPEKARGGPGINMGTHQVDIAAYLLRRMPLRVRGEAWNVHPQAVKGIEDRLRLELDFGDDFLAEFNIYSHLENGNKAYPASFTVCFEKGFCRFWSDRLTVHPNGQEAELRYQAERGKAYITFADQVELFVSYVQEQKRPLATAEYGAWLLACIETVTSKGHVPEWIDLSEYTGIDVKDFNKITGDWK